MKSTGSTSRMIVGWRELVSLPEWGVEDVVAKIDTGARTSALHVEDIRELPDNRVTFNIVLSRKNPKNRVPVEATLRRMTRVRPSSGKMQTRYVVATRMLLGGIEKEIEISLVRRDNMLCRMLLGRRAMEGDFLVDAGRKRLHAPDVRRKLGEKKMDIAILSRSPGAYSTRRLKEAAEARSMNVKILDTLGFSISLEEQYPDLYFRGRPVGHYDAVVPRIGASITYFGTAVVRQFEQMGVFAANTSLGITNSRDKLRSLQILSRHDIGIPATAFVRRKQDVLPTIERLGGAPVIIKLLEGTQGVGVILADTEKVAEAIIETLQTAKQNVLVQKFVAESKGRDVRAIVVGDQVVAAMRRVAQGQEFRSNVHRGGKTESVNLDAEYERTAVRSAQIMGLKVAGVDMLEGKDGPQVMEVNSSPGLEGIEGATGVDVAGAIMAYIQEHVEFPEIDVRERLSLSKGYGISEVTIPEGSPYVGKTIADSGLKQADVIVLRISRNNLFTTNPPGTKRFEANDRLLCFGKYTSLKGLLPEKGERRSSRSPRKQTVG